MGLWRGGPWAEGCIGAQQVKQRGGMCEHPGVMARAGSSARAQGTHEPLKGGQQDWERGEKGEIYTRRSG